MSNREKIVVVLMVLSLVYGGYIMFFKSPKQTEVVTGGGDRELEGLNKFITKIAEKTKSGFPQRQSYVLEKAGLAWKRDPLIQIEAEKVVATGPETVLDGRLKYTGFLQMGDTRLAIISGMEYELGDRLELGGFIVQRILPDHVVVVPSGKKKKAMILPMEETE